MTVGAGPRLQRSWDLRAAANFACGGAGSGLIVATALAGERGMPSAIALVTGVALVGAGLTSVWFELGRPWRALNVFRNPRTSWMSREAYVAVALTLVASCAAWLEASGGGGASTATLAAMAMALAFMVAQGRMLHAAKGIPAWRSPALPMLIVATALAEGAGLWWVATAARGGGTRAGLALLGVLVVARLVAWLAYRRTLARYPHVTSALAGAGAVLAWVGTLAPLALIVVASVATAERTVLTAAALAGALAFLAGWVAKAAIVVRGAYNQGYAVPVMPVRGTRR